MKHTKTNIIKLIKSDIESLDNLIESTMKSYDKTQEPKFLRWAEEYRSERIGLRRALYYLEDKEFFEKMCEILDVKEK